VTERTLLTAGARRLGLWMVITLAACTLLATRAALYQLTGRQLDPRLVLRDLDHQLWWFLLYYPMWALLTPAIFAAGRRWPIERPRVVSSLLFHVPASVLLAAAAPTILTVFYGVLFLGLDWPSPLDFLEPFWTRHMAFSAASDTTVYWLILGAGHGLRLYDENRARLLRAAELERSLVAAQVDSLRMKLQPHFLFNTLNSIAFLAIERDTQAVVTMVQRLATLVRASMSSGGRQLVPLDEELALLDQYLAIEEVRFRDRLRVTRRVDPAARTARLPSLVLQPIVENSIKHGFSKRLDASRLAIDVWRDGDRLHLTIGDDGAGLPAGWSLETQCGRGLRNVIERLDALYRGAWSFSLENGPRGGTVASMSIPFEGALD
jgi:two-component system, LytTR family, sensor kinase